MIVIAATLAAALGAASSRPVPSLSAASSGTVYYTAGASNVVASVTNSDSYYSSVQIVGAVSGSGVTLSAPLPIVQVDNYSVGVAAALGASLQFVAPGPVRARAVFSDGTGAAYSSVFLTNSAGTVTNNVWQSFRPGWLGYSLLTNFVARTNARPDPAPWSGLVAGRTNLAGVTLNYSNCLYGCAGFTAISPASDSGTQVTWTLLTRRHAYARGHDMGVDGGPALNPAKTGLRVWFLGTDNSTNEARIAEAVTVTGAEDWTVCLFSNDLPAVVESMAVLENSGLANIAGKLTNTMSAATDRVFPLLGTCQHNRLCTDTAWRIFDAHNARVGGDSGAPNFLLIGAQLVFVSGRTTTGYSPTMRTNLDWLTVRAGLSTNDYAPAVFSLAAFNDL